MERETLSCRWNSARTATRSDLSKRETLDRMKRSSRTGSDWSLLSSLAMMRPSFPNSFFRLHIERLGFDAEPVTNRTQLLLMTLAEAEEEALRSANASRSINQATLECSLESKEGPTWLCTFFQGWEL